MMKKWISFTLAIALMASMVYQGSSASFSIAEPNLSITSSISKADYEVNQTGEINYTIVPSGGVENELRSPAEIVLVLDTSGSMAYDIKGYSNTSNGYVGWNWNGVSWKYDFTQNPDKMSVMKDKAKAFVDFMSNAENGISGDRIKLVTFSTNAVDRGVFFFNKASNQSDSYESLKSIINGLQASGGTNYEASLNMAYSHLNGISSNNESIIFLSDGQPTYYLDQYGNRQGTGSSLIPSGEITQLISDTNTFRATNGKIHTISFGNTTEHHKIMSDMSGLNGIATTPSTANSLNSAFSRIAQAITSKSLTNNKITGRLPAGMTIDSSRIRKNADNLDSIDGIHPFAIDAQGNFTISLKDVEFKPDQQPDPNGFTLALPFKMTARGTYTVTSTLTYVNTGNQIASKNDTGHTVNCVEVLAPTITQNPSVNTKAKSVSVDINFVGNPSKMYYAEVPLNDPQPPIGSAVYKQHLGSAVKSLALTENKTIYAYSVDSKGNLTINSRIVSHNVTNVDRETTVQISGPVQSNQTSVSGTGEAGATVTLKVGNDIFENIKIDDNGNFVVDIKTKRPVGTVIEAVATDSAGNTATDTETVVDTIAPTVTINEITNQDNDSTKKANGKTEAGATVKIIVKDVDTKVETSYPSVVADSEGNYSVTIGTQKVGNIVTAVAIDAANNISVPASTTVIDKIPPQITLNPLDADDTSVTGKTEANIAVVIKIGDKVFGPKTSGSDGTFSFTIEKQLPGTDIIGQATDAAGNVGTATVQVATAIVVPTIRGITAASATGDKGYIQVIQKGSFIQNIRFKNDEAKKQKLTLSYAQAEALFGITSTDGAIVKASPTNAAVDGTTTYDFKVKKNSETKTIELESLIAIPMNSHGYTMKVLVKLGSTPLGKYTVSMEGKAAAPSGGKLIIDVIKNTKIK